MKIRLLMPADKPRNISFLIHGHRWKAQPDDPLSQDITVQGAMSVGNVFNIEPERKKCRGDYLYRSGSLRWDVESGMWGIFRVLNRNIRCHCETACRRCRGAVNDSLYRKITACSNRRKRFCLNFRVHLMYGEPLFTCCYT